MYEIIFHPEAEEELNVAISYYEDSKEGLGISFLHEIQKTIFQINDYPSSGSLLSGEIRKCHISRFPYFLIYKVEGSLISILAIAHTHRRPRYWIDRL